MALWERKNMQHRGEEKVGSILPHVFQLTCFLFIAGHGGSLCLSLNAVSGAHLSRAEQIIPFDFVVLSTLDFSSNLLF